MTELVQLTPIYLLRCGTCDGYMYGPEWRWPALPPAVNTYFKERFVGRKSGRCAICGRQGYWEAWALPRGLVEDV